MKRPCEDSSSAESEVEETIDVGSENIYPGSAKLEKAEILQMTVDHLKMLQATGGKGYFDAHAFALDFLSLGFRECVTEVSRYLSAVEGLDSGDPLRSRLLSHLASCASQRDAAALTTPHPLPHPFHHPHHWAAALAAFRPLPYRLSGLVSPDVGGGGGSQRGVVSSSFSSHADSTSSSPSSSSSSSLVLPCTPTPLSASLLSLSASFPIALHGGIPILPHSSFTSSAASPPVSSSSSSQTPHSSSSKPYRPWGTEVGAF
uniref:Hes-related family bHLH transcription factor with YRPW motif 2 n=1 Tax=Neolamprologus brichardi TaxID=32507 RepID=A0A3Q4ME12_NEOBR